MSSEMRNPRRLSAAVMSVYVPRELTPSYVLLWRMFVGYLTLGVGSYVFWRWLKLWEEQVAGEEADASDDRGDGASVAPPSKGD